MSGMSVSLPEKWMQFLKNLADDHDVDIDNVVSELCEWAFSNSESQEQFMIWLDKAYPPEGEAEDKARDEGDEAGEEEEETDEESEEESHEHRD